MISQTHICDRLTMSATLVTLDHYEGILPNESQREPNAELTSVSPKPERKAENGLKAECRMPKAVPVRVARASLRRDGKRFDLSC
jgi:hypothetical protein